MSTLLSGGSPKIEKSDKAGLGYLTKIMYLAPGRLSGFNACPWASPGCLRSCLNKSGRGYCKPVQDARIRRTRMLFENRDGFKSMLYTEIDKFVKRCVKLGQHPTVRLNGTSDIAWESIFPDMFVGFPQVQFYDYTKSLIRTLTQQRKNYHLTFSRTEDNDNDCKTVLRAGSNVAIVFSGKELPRTWKHFKVFNGDKTDLRFLDPQGICGLYAKGQAIYDESGFVVDGVSK